MLAIADKEYILHAGICRIGWLLVEVYMKKKLLPIFVICATFLLLKEVLANEVSGSLNPITNKLSCFTIKPSSNDKDSSSSCDKLCADEGAVCTGMQNGSVNPPITCSDIPFPGFSACRCCKVTP